MKRAALLILAALLVLGGWWTWRKLFHGDEVKIHRLLDNVAMKASFASGEKPLSAMTGAADFAACFTEDVVVKIDAPGGEISAIRGRSQIRQLALAARNQAAGLRVQFSEVSVTVREDGNAASTLVATARGGGMEEPFHQELKMQLRKVNGDWLISRVETVQALRRVE